jgi:hypothetical protein
MRQVATFLLFGVALTAGAAEIWRWKDANGVVHYSDNPVPGAERIIVNTPRPSGSGEPPAQTAATPAPLAPEPSSRPVAYTSCAVLSPARDETFRGVQAVSVTLGIEPALPQGHRIQVFVNGVARGDWPPESSNFTFPEVFRGSHTLNVRIVDQNGRTVCNGPSSTFHLQQVTVLSPARAVPPKPPTQPPPAPPKAPPAPTRPPAGG